MFVSHEIVKSYIFQDYYIRLLDIQITKIKSFLVKDPFERFFVEMEHQELKKERHQLKQLLKTEC